MELLTLSTLIHYLLILNIQCIFMATDSYSLFDFLHEQYCPSDPKELMVTSCDSQVPFSMGFMSFPATKVLSSSSKMTLELIVDTLS